MLKNKLIKFSGVHDFNYGFGEFNHETQVDSIYHNFNIKKKYHLKKKMTNHVFLSVIQIAFKII